MALKDATWAPVYEAIATELSATFKSSSGDTTWLRADKVDGITFQLVSSTLTGAASEIRITPKFRDAASTVTYATNPDGTRIYWPLSTNQDETLIYGPFDAYEVSAEIWLDTTDATAAAVVSAKRAKMEG